MERASQVANVVKYSMPAMASALVTKQAHSLVKLSHL
jgi:hypothetical protein